MAAVTWGLLVLWNFGAFAVMGYDKRAARRGQRRISERSLWGWALFFGALGIYAGMFVFRHKTTKPAFRLVVPLLLLGQIVLVYRWFVGA